MTDESRFDPALVHAMRAAGHDIEMLPAFTSTMGHAGALVRHGDGLIEGASDPRSDGAAIGFLRAICNSDKEAGGSLRGSAEIDLAQGQSSPIPAFSR